MQRQQLLKIKFYYIYDLRKLLFIFILFIPCIAIAQLQGVTVSLLSTEHGLADRDARCIIQDNDGFMWIGTGTGLYKYDGYTFTNYSKRLIAKTGSENSHISDLQKDRYGNIWIVYSRGIALMPHGTDTLQWVADPAQDFYPKTIYLDQNGQCWVYCINEKVYVLDSKKRCISKYIPARKGIFGHLVFFYEDAVKNMWLLSEDGTADIFTGNGTFTAHLNAVTLKDTGIIITDLLLKNGCIRQYAFSKQALAKFNIPLPVPSTDPAFFANTNLTNYKEQKGNVIKVNNRSCKIWYNDRADSMDITSLLFKASGYFDRINYIFQSSDNTVWLCCNKGILKINYEHTRFHNYLSQQLINNENEGISVRGMAEDDSGNIWIGTYQTLIDGKKRSLFKISAKSGKIQPVNYKYAEPYNVRTDDCYFLLADKNKLWITKEAARLFYMDMRDHVVYEAGRNQSKYENIITNIARAGDSSFYFGGYNGTGIVHPYNRTGAYTYFTDSSGHIPPIRITNILPGASGDYWVTSFRGIYHLDKEALIIDHYDEKGTGKVKLPGNIIYTICFDKGGIMWAGSKNGLIKIDTGEHTVALYTEKDGLCNNTVYAIVPDAMGYLWLSTNYGVSRFNPHSGLFINYYTGDNLPHNEFNHISYLKARDGRIYFGGLNGITAFYPADFDTAFSALPVRLISASKYDGKKESVMIITSRPSMPGHVVLDYMDKLLSFNIMLPSYSNPSQNRFSYRLEGWDKEWQFLKGSNTIAYSYLLPGTYKLHIRGARPGETWSKNELVIDVVVLQAWFKTWWFYTLCALCVTGLGYLLYRMRMQQIIRDQNLRNKISADLHDELGTVLTQISIQSELLKSNIYSEQEKEKELDNINSSSRLAINAMSDIVWSIKSGTDRLADLIDRMRDHVDMVLQPHNADIRFTVQGINEQAIITAKLRQQIFFIFKEAIHNILQHSNASVVTIDIADQKGYFTMNISNNHITQKKVNKIGGNGLKNMQMRAALIKGTIETIKKEDVFIVYFRCKI